MSVLMIVLLSVFGTLVITGGFAILVLAFLTFARVAALPALDVRMAHVEQYLREISDSPDASSPHLYRTADGKHTAGSLEELAIKIMNDPESDMNQDQKTALQEFLSQIEKETKLTSFDDDDDEDDDDEKLV